MALEFLLLSLGFNSFLSLRDEQNSMRGVVLAVIKCIYLSPAYIYFIQDIEDRCLLLMSSTSFVDIPLQGTSDDGKAPYGPKSIHILIMSKTRGVHGQYDTKGRCDTRPGPSRPKVGPVDQPCPGVFPNTVFTTCQSKSVRGVSNVEKVVERLNVATWPSIIVGWPNKWASHAQSSARSPPTPPINTPVLPLVESVKKVRFSPL
jgi:hypothetical protein